MQRFLSRLNELPRAAGVGVIGAACVCYGGLHEYWRPTKLETLKRILGRANAGTYFQLPFAPVSHGAFCEAAPLSTLHSELHPFETGMLITADGKHKLYYEVSGNPRGKPALFLHGGPGDGSSSKHRRLFDPAVYRIVVFDQRGAGKSLPAGSVEANTTSMLIEDCEQLRRHINVDRWSLVVGGSWGSTLALAYAQKHPNRIQNMVLYSIFLGTKQSIDWLYNAGGASMYYPEEYNRFISHLTEKERAVPLQSYHRRINSFDDAVRLSAMSSLAAWELTCLALTPDSDFITSVVSNPQGLGHGQKIALHYMVNNCFLADDQLLTECTKLKDIPCIILHGRYDMLCTPAGAWHLHQAMPRSTLQIIPESGHSSSAAPRLKSALVDAINSFC